MQYLSPLIPTPKNLACRVITSSVPLKNLAALVLVVFKRNQQQQKPLDQPILGLWGQQDANQSLNHNWIVNLKVPFFRRILWFYQVTSLPFLSFKTPVLST